MAKKPIKLNIKEMHNSYNKEKEELALKNLKELLATMLYEYAKNNK